MLPIEWLKYAPKPRPLKQGEKWHVFLSYRSSSRPWVLNLYDVLTELGYKVFLDQYNLIAGDTIVSKLEDALSESQAGIFIWSNLIKDSEWVRNEYIRLESRKNQKKDFQSVFIKLDKTELPPFARNRIFIDFSDYPDGPNGGELIRLLYAIANKPVSSEALHFITEQDEDSKDQSHKVNAAISNNNPEKLKQLFEQGKLAWKISATLGCKAAEGLIKLKRYDDALAMLNILEQEFKKALRPKQLKALALARRGDIGDLELAQEILGEMYVKKEIDSETLSIYGRTWMDRYKQSGDLDHLRRSRDLYAEAFEKAPDDYYAGINAASKSVLIGTEDDLLKAAEYAARVEKITGIEPVKGDYWKTATIAEMLLLQRKYREAADMYARAIAMARSELGSHESTYLQAKEIMEKLNPTKTEREMVDSVFKYLSSSAVKKRLKVLISYSHKDIDILDELNRYLNQLERAGRIELLIDKGTEAGDIWSEKQEKFVNEADIILILVSLNSLNSSSVDKETQTAIKQFEKGFSLVIPIQIEPCNWASSPLFRLQFLMLDRKKLYEVTNKTEWYTDFIRTFENFISEIGKDWFEKIRPELYHRTSNVDLSNSKLSVIPFVVTQMHWLSVIQLSNNRIENIRPLLVLGNLTSIDLSSNIITDADGLTTLSNLIYLDLSYNEIARIPDLANSRGLTYLNMGFNGIKRISNLTGHSHLNKLHLAENEIEIIEGIENLSSLTLLDLSKNKITQIDGLHNLTNLTDLILAGNKIEKLQGIHTLINLQRLDLHANQISEIEGLENNKLLKSLELSSNKVTALKNIGHLDKLESFLIDHNNIEDISELRHMRNLKRVILTNNKISDLFPLKEFIEKDIPVKIEYNSDSTEDGFFIKDNPIQYPPIEVVVQGKDAILRNFIQQGEALQEQLSSYHSNDIKLILIGNANVGKTFLASYIKSNRKELPDNNASTHGMINTFAEYFLPTAVKMRILDFGGQEYYHDTHHLFFTNDTIYLLLWENESNRFGEKTEERFSVKTGQVEKENNTVFPVAYWLDAVNYFINKKEEERRKNSKPILPDNGTAIKEKTLDPSVILVETKRNKKGSTLLDTVSILPYRGIIHSQVAISLHRNEQNEIISTGIDSLFDNLNDLISSISEKKWSGYYRLIVSFFENMDSNSNIDILKQANASALIITVEDCLELFNKIMQDKKYKYEFDNDNAMDLCRFLANRGYILYFDINKICLRPEKLTKEIYSVLNKKYNDIGIITNEEAFVHDEAVLNVMKDFKLLIPHPNGKSLIAPQLLPEDTSSQLKMFLDAFKPPVIQFSLTGYIHKNIIQELFYSFKEILIKENTQNYIWKNGFIINIENELYKINIRNCENCRLIEIQYLNFLNPRILNEISSLITTALAGRQFEKEVSNDGKLFVPISLIQKSIQLSQFVYKENLLRVADYKNFLDNEAKNYAMKKLFISYSSKNTAFMRRFVTHLEPLKRNGAIDYWHDRMIEPGTKWDESIKKELELSDIIVFLLSPDFIATNYIFDVEIPLAINQFKNQKQFFFIELQPCSWHETILAQFQQTTDPTADNKGVIIISDPLNDAQWKNVIIELEKKLNHFKLISTISTPVEGIPSIPISNETVQAKVV